MDEGLRGVETVVDGSNGVAVANRKPADIRWKVCGEFFQGGEFRAQGETRGKARGDVHEDGDDCLGGTGVVDDLVGEENAPGVEIWV